MFAVAGCGGDDGGKTAPAGGSDASGAATSGGGSSGPAAPARPDAARAPGPEEQAAADARAMAAVVEEYYAAIREGSLDRLFAVLTPDQVEYMGQTVAHLLDGPKEKWAEQYRAKAKSFEIKIMPVKHDQWDGDWGKVRVERPRDGFTGHIDFQVTKKDGKWLIADSTSDCRGSGVWCD